MKNERVIHFDFTEKKADDALKRNYREAEETLLSEDMMERLLQRLEVKLKTIPKVGDKLAMIPVFASLVKSYVKKEYRDLPVGSIVAIVGALIYVVNHLDVIPDSIPLIGFADDALVIAACLRLVDSDVQEYIKWREKNGKTIEF